MPIAVGVALLLAAMIVGWRNSKAPPKSSYHADPAFPLLVHEVFGEDEPEREPSLEAPQVPIVDSLKLLLEYAFPRPFFGTRPFLCRHPSFFQVLQVFDQQETIVGGVNSALAVDKLVLTGECYWVNRPDEALPSSIAVLRIESSIYVIPGIFRKRIEKSLVPEAYRWKMLDKKMRITYLLDRASKMSPLVDRYYADAPMSQLLTSSYKGEELFFEFTDEESPFFMQESSFFYSVKIHREQGQFFSVMLKQNCSNPAGCLPGEEAPQILFGMPLRACVFTNPWVPTEP